MIYLLATDACIALINGRPMPVRVRFQQAIAAGAAIAVSAVVVSELWYGVAKSARKEDNTRCLEVFLAGPMELLPLDEEDARTASEIRAALAAAETPIGAYDLLIAGQARRRSATLVTANAAEFARVAGLGWEDWAASC